MIKIFDNINRLFSNIGNSNKKEDLAHLNNQNKQKQNIFTVLFRIE